MDAIRYISPDGIRGVDLLADDRLMPRVRLFRQSRPIAPNPRQSPLTRHDTLARDASELAWLTWAELVEQAS